MMYKCCIWRVVPGWCTGHGASLRNHLFFSGFLFPGLSFAALANWAYLIVLVNVIVPWSIAIFITIRIPALRVVHITHNIPPGRRLCESQFAEVVAEIFGKIQHPANFLLSYFCKK